MSVSAPPRPPRPGDPISREEAEALVEALIEEARQRARRRRQKYAAFAMVATLAAVVVTTVLARSTGAESQSPALAARSALAAGTPSSRIVFTSSVSRRPLAACHLRDERRRERGGGWRGDGHPPGRRTGSSLAFTDERDGNPVVYVMDADGNRRRNGDTEPGGRRQRRVVARGRKVACVARLG